MVASVIFIIFLSVVVENSLFESSKLRKSLVIFVNGVSIVQSRESNPRWSYYIVDLLKNLWLLQLPRFCVSREATGGKA